MATRAWILLSVGCWACGGDEAGQATSAPGTEVADSEEVNAGETTLGDASTAENTNTTEVVVIEVADDSQVGTDSDDTALATDSGPSDSTTEVVLEDASDADAPADTTSTTEVVDTSTTEVVDTDTADTDTGPTPYPATGSGRQLLWQDEFNGRPCDPARDGSCQGAEAARVAACYNGQANLQHKFHAGPGDTVRETLADLPALADLDKCVWTINHHVNYIHFTNDQRDLIQLYDPRMIQVTGGELRLGTRFDHGTGPCGTNANPEDPAGQHCPYLGAALTTIPFNGPTNAFPKAAGPFTPGDGLVMPSAGRIAIRAKLPSAKGNMAALWTWATGSPFEHEHDILEYFLNWPSAHHQGEVQYHHGQTSEHGAWVISDASANVDRSAQFHVYAMEWARGGSLRYLFDEVEVARIDVGDGVLSTGQLCWAEEVNGNPFYLILWNLMTTYWYAPEVAPVGPGQPPDWLHIDWVRLYERCSGTACVEVPNAGTCERPCDGFGTWNGAHCDVGAPPAGASPAIFDGQYGYPAAAASGCPYGGTRVADGCVLGAPPAGRTALIGGGRYLATAVCAPGEGLRNCARPCPWPGTTADAQGCYVGAPPAGHAAFVYDHNFYYEPSDNEPRCPDGATFDSAHCYVGPAPAGAVPVILGGAYYLEPDHCAYGGTWDAARGACLYLRAPAGRTAFNYEGNAYYTGAPADPPCRADATFDSANCFVAVLPAGADAFVDAATPTDLWLAATCGDVTAGASAAANPDYNSCSDPQPGE